MNNALNSDLKRMLLTNIFAKFCEDEYLYNIFLVI